MKTLKNNTFIAIIGVLISAIALFLNERYLKLDAVMYTFVMTVFITLLTNCIILFISDKFSDNNLNNNVKEINNIINEVSVEKFSCIKYCTDYGLEGIYSNFPLNNEIIKNDFINTKNLYIVMNDAKAFISSNITLIEQRVKAVDCTTTFILQDYQQQDIMNALTRKNGHKNGYYENKIKEVIEYHLKQLITIKDSNHNINLYLNNNYNTLSIILTDEYAIISIYRIALGKTEVPHFLFKKNGKEYINIKNDIEKILERAKKINL